EPGELRLVEVEPHRVHPRMRERHQERLQHHLAAELVQEDPPGPPVDLCLRPWPRLDPPYWTQLRRRRAPAHEPNHRLVRPGVVVLSDQVLVEACIFRTGLGKAV